MYERMPTGDDDLGFVKVVSGQVPCDYCEEGAVLQFRFRESGGPPMTQAGCRGHAADAALGAHRESKELA